jgi:hypothetical protein
MAATDDVFGGFADLILEHASRKVHNLTLEDPDDPAWALMGSFEPEEKAGRRTGSDEGSPGFEASWRVRIQRGGRVTGGSFAGNTLANMGTDDVLHVGRAADALYLDPVHTPRRSYLKVKMLLKRLRGQVTCELEEILADLATDPLEEVAADGVEDVVAKVRKLYSTMFWSQGYGIMALVNDAAPAVIGENAGDSWVTIDAGTPFRFEIGDRYVASSLSVGTPYGGTTRAGTLNDPGVFRCTGINTDDRTVKFESEAGEGDITIADNDAIIHEGMYNFGAASAAVGNYAPNGIEQLLIATGTYPGTAYDVDEHTQLASYVSNNEADPIYPKPEVIGAMIDKITEPKKAPPSTLVAETSLWTLYSQIERSAGAIYPVAQGAGFTASGGVEMPVISHNGRRFAALESSLIRPGMVAGLAPETFKRFTPLGDRTIRWAMTRGPLANVGSIFRAVTSGRQLTELMVADFNVFFQIGQTDPRRCFLARGIHSQRTADALGE